jgi:helix-turn-helix, Psq domain
MEIELKKRGSYANKYTEENIRMTLNEIGSGSLSAYAASKKFNIPRQTLSDKIKDEHALNP